jgi:hypothetical protein
MKRLVFVVALLVVLFGCAVGPRVTIPDAPTYKQLKIWPVPNGVCFDEEGLGLLRDNIRTMSEYAGKVRAELERVRDGK